MKMPEPKLKWYDLLPSEVIFTWEDPETGKQFSWAVARLEKFLTESLHSVTLMHVDKEFAASLVELRGLEPQRFKNIPKNMSDWVPIIVAQMPDGTGLMVDGNHRYYVAGLIESESIMGWLVPERIWKNFLVEMPGVGQLQGTWSGLL